MDENDAEPSITVICLCIACWRSAQQKKNNSEYNSLYIYSVSWCCEKAKLFFFFHLTQQEGRKEFYWTFFFSLFSLPLKNCIFFIDQRCPRIVVQLDIFCASYSIGFIFHAQPSSWCPQRVSIIILINSIRFFCHLSACVCVCAALRSSKCFFNHKQFYFQNQYEIFFPFNYLNISMMSPLPLPLLSPPHSSIFFFSP